MGIAKPDRHKILKDFLEILNLLFNKNEILRSYWYMISDWNR